jgi:hypothetical protein
MVSTRGNSRTSVIPLSNTIRPFSSEDGRGVKQIRLVSKEDQRRGDPGAGRVDYHSTPGFGCRMPDIPSILLLATSSSCPHCGPQVDFASTFLLHQVASYHL